MIVTVNLPDPIAEQFSAKAAANCISLEEFLLSLAMREAKAPPTEFYPLHFAPPEVWSRVLRQWAASHPPVDHLVDDSRESIYEGCGE
jgi:hypothetical protein